MKFEVYSLEKMLSLVYGINHCEVIPIARGTMNQCYRINFSGGVRFLKSYAVRFYQPEQIHRACQAQSLAYDSGLPTPKTILNKHGHAVTVESGGVYVLNEFLMGDEYSKAELPTPAAHQMGVTLARLQAILTRLGDPVPMKLLEPETAIANFQSLLARAEAESSRAEVDCIACDLLRYKIEALHRHGAIFSEVQNFPAQWVHGDYQVSNLIFGTEGNVTSVLDFDQLQRRPRGLEMMRALDFSFSYDQILHQPGQDFFRGYFEAVALSSAALSEEEVRLFAPMWMYYWLVRPWPLDVRYGRPEDYDTRWDALIQPPTKWWEQNLNRVTEQFLKLLPIS